MVDPWRQPFPQIKPFRNGMAATSSFFAKQALRLPLCWKINLVCAEPGSLE